MKNNLKLPLILLTATFLFLPDSQTVAQKRRPIRGKARASKTTTRTPLASAAANAVAVKDGAQKVNDQIKALSRFLYLYGGSVQPLKTFDNDAKQNKLSAAAKREGEVGKKAILVTFATFRNSMLKLEEDFRASPALKSYLLQLVGVSEYATTAEQQAQANQFDQAGRTLLEALNQLSDTLQAMP